jgi:hypothetical protein
METEKKIRTRRKFIFGFGVSSLLAAIGITLPTKKITLSCAPPGRKRTIKMLTKEGNLVEVDEDKIIAYTKKITDEELKVWVKK